MFINILIEFMETKRIWDRLKVRFDQFVFQDRVKIMKHFYSIMHARVLKLESASPAGGKQGILVGSWAFRFRILFLWQLSELIENKYFNCLKGWQYPHMLFSNQDSI